MGESPGRMTPDTLHLGCGLKKFPNAVNVDHVASTNPDVVHDLNVCPWPFREGQFAAVHAYDVLEHLGDLVSVVSEIHRVSRDGALVHITVPHFSSANAFTDPTHRHHFGVRSFDYFTDGNPLSFYSKARFKARRRELVFHPTLVNKIVWRLARRFPEEYERRWAWIFPAWFLGFELEVVKTAAPTDAAARMAG